MAKLKAKFINFLKIAEDHGLISLPVRIGKFQEECEQLLLESEMDFRKKKDFSVETLSKEMGVDEETVRELEDVCSPSSLVCPRENEIPHWEDVFSIPSDTGLVALNHCKKAQADRYRDDSKSKYLVKCKYTEMDCALLARAYNTPAKNEEDAVKCPEVVITVCVRFPRDERRYKSCGVDYLVLGSQKLAELRDKIPCALDLQPVGNFTDNPNLSKDILLKDLCTSSFFFIENTFFNDRRSPTSADLSKGIIEWASKNETAVPENPQTALMEETTFNDLQVRFGCPYVFLHQGDCEHQISFKDIRLFNANDCQSRSAYPISVSKAKCKSTVCHVCNVHLATWFTRGDTLATEDPAFFCDSCFKLLHYDKQGNKLGDFVAFPRINVPAMDY